MVNLVFFNANWPTRGLQTQNLRSNRGAAICEFVEGRHSSRNLSNVTKPDRSASSRRRSFIRIFGKPFKILNSTSPNVHLEIVVGVALRGHPFLPINFSTQGWPRRATPTTMLSRYYGGKLTREDETECSQQTRIVTEGRGEDGR